jgi:hypothetical protein
MTSLPPDRPDSSVAIRNAAGDAALGRVSRSAPTSSPSTGTRHAASAATQQATPEDEPPASPQHAISLTSSGQAPAIEHQTSRNMGMAAADGAAAMPSSPGSPSTRTVPSKTRQPEVLVIPDEGSEDPAGPGSAASSQSFYDDEETPFSQVSMFACAGSVGCRLMLHPQRGLPSFAVRMANFTSWAPPASYAACWEAAAAGHAVYIKLTGAGSIGGCFAAGHLAVGRLLGRLRGTGLAFCNQSGRGSWVSDCQ